MHPRPSIAAGFPPVDDDKSRAISLRGEAACTLGRRCRPASRPATTRSSARSPCGERRYALSAVDVARHLARRQQEVPPDFLAGQCSIHSRPSMSLGISPGDNDKSRAISLQGKAAFPLGRQCRPASRPATTTSPARYLLARRGGMHSRPSMLPGISPGDDDKSRAISLRGEAACTRGRRCRPASHPATRRSPA